MCESEGKDTIKYMAPRIPDVVDVTCKLFNIIGPSILLFFQCINSIVYLYKSIVSTV